MISIKILHLIHFSYKTSPNLAYSIWFYILHLVAQKMGQVRCTTFTMSLNVNPVVISVVKQTKSTRISPLIFCFPSTLILGKGSNSDHISFLLLMNYQILLQNFDISPLVFATPYSIDTQLRRGEIHSNNGTLRSRFEASWPPGSVYMFSKLQNAN